ncbi:uncharacterized protein M421DRAFT_416610 [Didymella exigua CBS 183.55]|uniref:CFEM domain-containing protein n=1 Tax=Didymella exigua CBS 183.55 TaxID=1150837 RepID=A0A6A5S144_9PLEO|nr:uncharacterized protein M421DRAFT_416610 [Didymella exigua CBS 183.55]KAF1933008.1 hypothetical protein M421DRAFT_416610 [Didymella exigua CBS 183.55]
MRFSTIAAFATSLAVVSAQTPDLSAVPNCAVACLIAAIPGSGCGVTDVTCQCTTGQSAITSSLESCIPNACSATEAAQVAPALAGICSAAGISVAVPSGTSMAASMASSAVASAASSAAATVSSAMSMASSAVASARSSAASAASSAAASASSRASSAASATSSGPAQSTGGAAANAAGLGAVALGMFAALF